ncbi:MAG TPA: rhodanese-like domain-containing protein [Chitinophagaceae bacterium]|nr:rhodanese-like domain-containing protein [Chitinophagaceae bacterium]
MSLLEKLFGKPTDFKSIYEKGAIILDVRTPEEFSSGHIKGAVNIPVGQLKQHIPDLKKKNRPVITCCRSGVRSGMARVTLASEGLEVYNGGPWNELQQKIK